MRRKPIRALSALLPSLGMILLSGPAAPSQAKKAHDCGTDKRWVDTLPDGNIRTHRCYYDPLAAKCLSPVDIRPWTPDTLLNEILSLASRRASSALIRIDSVKSSFRDSAFRVDGVDYVERHMKEDIFLTVEEALRGSMETGPWAFHEAWNMGNVLDGAEYVSFLPGRGQAFLVFYNPEPHLAELVRPATECDRELGGYRVLDGKVRPSGENTFPDLSVDLAAVRAALSSLSIGPREAGNRPRTRGREPWRALARPGDVGDADARDIRGRAVGAGGLPLRKGTGSLGILVGEEGRHK